VTCFTWHVGHSLLQISLKVFLWSLLRGYALLRVSCRVCRSLASLYARLSLTQAGTGDIGGVLTTMVLFVRLCYLVVLDVFWCVSYNMVGFWMLVALFGIALFDDSFLWVLFVGLFYRSL